MGSSPTEVYVFFLSLLSWRKHQKPQKKASKAKAPVLQSVDEGVMEKQKESVEMEEVKVSAGKIMELRKDEASEKDCDV